MGPIGNLSPGGSIALGIVVGLLSTSVQSVGLTLQRKSHILEDEKGPHDTRRPPYLRRRWQLGMAMFIVANLLGSSIQISTLPLPVLSTLQAAGLVFNSICATLILGETFTRWSLGGTLLVSTGAVLIAVFGAIPSPTHDLDELLALLARRPFIAWMALQAVFVVALALGTDVVAGGVSGLACRPGFRLVRGIGYGVISGALSAHSLLLAKSAVELLIKSLGGHENQFVHWQAWALVLALVALALCQLYYLHRGLKLVSTSVLYPLVFCVYNIVAILDGLIYFDQTALIPALHAALIALGTAILLSGVLALSWRLGDDHHAPAAAAAAVSQSSLAPGLGLLDGSDADANDDDGLDLQHENLSLASSSKPLLLPSTSDAGSSSTTYQTFPPDQATPLLAPARGKGLAWLERAQIWDELHDRDDLPLARSAPLHRRHRRRSTGLPGFSARRGSFVPGSSFGSLFSLGWWAGRDREPPLSPGTRRDNAEPTPRSPV